MNETIVNINYLRQRLQGMYNRLVEAKKQGERYVLVEYEIEDLVEFMDMFYLTNS